MIKLLLRLNCNFQSGEKCNRSTSFFMNLYGFHGALKSLEVLQLVFKTVYDNKKIGIQKKGPAEKKSNLEVNLTCFKGNLHELKTCAVVQICL